MDLLRLLVRQATIEAEERRIEQQQLAAEAAQAASLGTFIRRRGLCEASDDLVSLTLIRLQRVGF